MRLDRSHALAVKLNEMRTVAGAVGDYEGGAQRTPTWQCAPRATLAPIVQVVLAESIVKLPTLKLRLPITSADLLRNGLPIVTSLTALAVFILCRLNEIVRGV
jgi:hypothetical protein